MSRVALLIGVSRYPTGLEPLPDAQKDAMVMQRVLKQCQFETELCCDRAVQDMQETMEVFFKHCAPDDQVVVLFCGYILQDADGRLYFATSSTKLDEQGAIVKAQTIPFSIMQEAMNGSPAKQQVVVLDSHFRSIANSPDPAANVSALVTQLGGAGRVFLMADTSRQGVTPAGLDVWTYTRYLAEGIESGAADTDDDGLLSADDVHHYATQKLQIAAPALQPQMDGSTETAQIPLFEVPIHTPQLSYRKVLETAATSSAIGVAGEPVLEGRSLLNDMRHELGLTPQEATEIELQALRPQRDYRQRVEFYQEQAAAITRSHDTASPQVRQALKQLQQSLYLHDNNVAMLTLAPYLTVQQNQQAQHQKNLAQYQQVLLKAMQRQYPLLDGDRTMLQRLQQSLQLKDDDAQAAEAQITAQATQLMEGSTETQTDATKTPDAQPTATQPTATQPIATQPTTTRPTATRPTATQPTATQPTATQPIATQPTTTRPIQIQSAQAQSTDAQTAPTPTEPTPRSPTPPLSGAQKAVLEMLMNPQPDQPVEASSSTPSPTPNSAPPPSISTLSREEPRSAVSTSSSTPKLMDRIRRSATDYQALLVPAILLAAIAGIVIAILPSSSRPNWFKFGQTPVNPAAAQQLNSEGLSKAQEGFNKEAIDDYNKAIEQNPNDGKIYINRGVAYHKTGDTGAAIRDYEQALKLDPNSAPAHSNLSYVYYDRQNYDKALEEGNAAVALDGRLAQAHINIANARAKKGDYGGALQDYNQAITLRPGAEILAGAFNNRGNVQLAQNKTRDALNDYSEAIKRNRNYADAYYNLGLAQQVTGNRTEAIKNLQTAGGLYSNQGNAALQKEATDRANAIQQGG